MSKLGSSVHEIQARLAAGGTIWLHILAVVGVLCLGVAAGFRVFGPAEAGAVSMPTAAVVDVVDNSGLPAPTAAPAGAATPAAQPTAYDMGGGVFASIPCGDPQAVLTADERVLCAAQDGPALVVQQQGAGAPPAFLAPTEAAVSDLTQLPPEQRVEAPGWSVPFVSGYDPTAAPQNYVQVRP